MNYRTTFLLLLFVALAGAGYYFGPKFVPGLPWASTGAAEATDSSERILGQELTESKLSRISVHSTTSDLTLEKGPGGEWSLQGKWPVRKSETNELVRILSHLKSRFEPIKADQTELDHLGLDKPAVTVTVQAGDTKHELKFAEEKGDQNRFSRPTYVRIDNLPEVIRLGPGLIAQIDKPQDYYQQRRLFPSERVAREGDAADRVERVDRLNARELDVKGPAASYTLVKPGSDWQLSQPVKDRVDPDKLNLVLGAVPDVWAESFVAKPKADLAEYGLKDPKESIRVVRPSGDVVTLLIGKQSQVKVRKVLRPAPNMGGPPMPPQEEMVHDEYRYAKLAGNDQVFEILAGKLKDLFVPGPSLRDPKLARFKPDDVHRLEIRRPDLDLVLVKDKDKWKIEKPLNVEAEMPRITELLDKLSTWQATGKEVIDNADAKTYGLDKPAATITVGVEDEVKEGDNKVKRHRDIVFNLGKVDADKGKLFVRVGGWERVNQEDDSAWKLVERPALAYRARRIIDSSSSDIARIDVSGPKEKVDLEQAKGEWKLTAPVATPADRSKAGMLAEDLSRLEAVEFVAEKATPETLDKTYGLTKPALTVKLSFSDAKKQPVTLLVGKEQKAGGDYYAKLESAPAVFTIRKDIFDALSQNSLAYRPLQLSPTRLPDDIRTVKIEKGGPEYTLEKKGEAWKLTGPFDAEVKPDAVRPIIEELASLNAEKYVAHTAKDLAAYGLDKPYEKVTLPAPVPAAGTPPPATPAKPITLLIGKPTEGNPKSRYAKLADSDAIAILPEKAVAALDRAALDFVDRAVLSLDGQRLEKIKAYGFTLQKKGDGWQVVDSPAPAFPANPGAMSTLLGSLAHLQAARFVSYGGKPELAKYGLDKPSADISISLQGPDGKPQEHKVLLGKTTDGKSTERFARVDQGGVFVLPETAYRPLLSNYLAYVNPELLSMDPGKIASISRLMNGETVEFVRKENGWEVKAKSTHRGDTSTLNALVDELARLHVERVAAYPAQDVTAYGLDKPEAAFTLHGVGADGKPASQVVQIGKSAGKGEHFVRVEKGTTIGVLPAAIVARLIAPALEYRDRNLANVSGVDRATLIRGSREAVFETVAGTWKLVQPISAPAEQTDLQEFLASVSHLRADRLVADKPADLKTYGLDKPAAKWIFQSAGKTVLELLLGKTAEPGKIYAKLAGSDLVFVLDQGLTKQAEAEYRARAAWSPPLDAVQIDRIQVTGQQGSFTLEKVENTWKLATKSEAINQDVVKELLDCLAGLKAAHFAADKTSDFKLFGLDPAQRTIEIQTPSGSRKLLIGRPEGESMRRYARIPEAEIGQGVFILSEEDSRKLMRAADTYLQNKVPVTAPK
jgi:hypothetical protein